MDDVAYHDNISHVVEQMASFNYSLRMRIALVSMYPVMYTIYNVFSFLLFIILHVNVYVCVRYIYNAYGRML